MNLIDTPGHVDFAYEVSRSLICCEGALLLVDAFQGVEAQTIANAYAALENDLTVVAALNKIDLKHARLDEVLMEIEHSLGIHADEVLRVSGKAGIGIAELLEAIITRIPPPQGDPAAALQAMVFDSHYDEFRGAITYVRVMSGRVRKGQKIKFLQAGLAYEVLELGQFAPRRQAVRGTASRPGRLPDLQHQVPGARTHRRHRQYAGAFRRAAAGLSPAAADGLLWTVSVRRAGLYRVAGRVGKALD